MSERALYVELTCGHGLGNEELGEDPAIVEDQRSRIRREHDFRDRVHTQRIAGSNFLPGLEAPGLKVQARDPCRDLGVCAQMLNVQPAAARVHSGGPRAALLLRAAPRVPLSVYSGGFCPPVLRRGAPYAPLSVYSGGPCAPVLLRAAPRVPLTVY